MFSHPGKIKWSDYYISKEKVLSMLKTKRTLLEDIQKRKLGYFGHIQKKKQSPINGRGGESEGKAAQRAATQYMVH